MVFYCVPAEIQPILANKRPSNIAEKFYNTYIQIIINVLYRFCRDLNELHYMVKSFKYILVLKVKINNM
jgi:hypothetical protein